MNTSLLFTFLFVALASGCSQSPQEKIAVGNAAILSSFADSNAASWIITFDKSSEMVFENHAHLKSHLYTVCGVAVVDRRAWNEIACKWSPEFCYESPPRRERFWVIVNSTNGKGYAQFDGSSDPLFRAHFQAEWQKKCPGYDVNAPHPGD